MCEFCVKHGDGRKWYLNASNYAEELLEDMKRVRYIEDFIPEITDNAARWLRIIDRGRRRSPAVTSRILRVQSRRMKSVHYGQVLPIEDVESVLGIVGQVVRLPCICREVLEKKQRATCYLVAASPDRLGYREIMGRREEAMPYVDGMERIDAAGALEEMKALEKEGCIHTVWTFLTPFIGAICNCDPRGCLALNFTERGLPLYFEGEEIITLREGECTACGECVGACIFGALEENGDDPVRVDPGNCRGCGVCRGVCPADALHLVPRSREAAVV